MKVVVTGQVGIDKKPFLEKLQAMARAEGRQLDVFHIGQMMYAEAPDIAAGRILDLPLARLHGLRRPGGWTHPTPGAAEGRAPDCGPGAGAGARGEFLRGPRQGALRRAGTRAERGHAVPLPEPARPAVLGELQAGKVCARQGLFVGPLVAGGLDLPLAVHFQHREQVGEPVTGPIF